VWGIVYLVRAIPEPPKDKLINLTLSFYSNALFEVGGQKKLTDYGQEQTCKGCGGDIIGNPAFIYRLLGN